MIYSKGVLLRISTQTPFKYKCFSKLVNLILNLYVQIIDENSDVW
jgi:hypothetical protein